MSNDEPVFILRGRDNHAGMLVEIWALIQQRYSVDDAKIGDALNCAKAMDAWTQRLGGDPIAARAVFEDAIFRFTKGLEEHPDDYDGVCDCNTCLSYD